MKYTDLTLNQRISLKGYFENDPSMERYKAVWLLWGFVKAVEYFLNDNLDELSLFGSLDLEKECTTCGKVGHTYTTCKEIPFFDTLAALFGVRSSF